MSKFALMLVNFFGALFSPFITSSLPLSRFSKSPYNTPFLQNFGKSTLNFCGEIWLPISLISSYNHLMSLYFVFSSTGFISMASCAILSSCVYSMSSSSWHSRVITWGTLDDSWLLISIRLFVWLVVVISGLGLFWYREGLFISESPSELSKLWMLGLALCRLVIVDIS